VTRVTDTLDEVILETVGSLGRVRLNRPKALNSLTLPMVRLIDDALTTFEADPHIATVLITGEGERGLCAGGDIRALYDSGKAGNDLAETFWREEYRLNARISHYPKPYVAVASGITMGGGVGVSAHGSHRLVTETTRFAMPETGIGFFPDVGGTWLLSRGPGDFGTFLGLTGDQIGASDAIHAGLADHFVVTDRLPSLIVALSNLEPASGADGVTAAIEDFASTASSSKLTPHYGDIDRLFTGDTVEGILAGLERDGSDFALATQRTLLAKSPTSLVVTLALLRLGRDAASLEECLEREMIVGRAILSGVDFYEGVRAAIIDKDRNPQWMPPTLSAVGNIDHYFGPSDVAKLFQ
jgi:enoyl-CoA hydratase